MRLIIFFFLFSRISSNNPVREKCRIYAMIQLGHKNCGSNRAVRTMEKQLDWPFWRSQNPACQASLLSLVLRSAYFSFFFLLLFFFFFFIRDDYRMRYGSRPSVKIPRVIRDLCDLGCPFSLSIFLIPVLPVARQILLYVDQPRDDYLWGEFDLNTNKAIITEISF